MITTLESKFWPVSNRCIKEADNPHLGSISGRYCLSVKTLLLKSNSYAEAKSWRDLEYAFTESLKSSSLDEFILLQHTASPRPQGWRSKYVRPVSYKRLDEVPKLLLANTSRTSATPAHLQRPHAEASTGVQPGDGHDGKGQQDRIDIPQERIFDGKEEEEVISSDNHDIPQERIADGKEAEGAVSREDHEEETYEIRVNAAKAVQDAYRHLEQRQATAARKIQAAYRHRLERKRGVPQGIDTVQAHYWHLLRKRSMEMEWVKGSRYYLLFRVPLAYILVCLDTIKVFVESEKKEAKKRVMTEDKGLEELMGALRQLRCDSDDCTL